MKNRNGRRATRSGQNGDYMIRSRTRSGSEERLPMTIEYCRPFKEVAPKGFSPTEITIDQFAAEAYPEEFQLIQSGDFVITAPSCNNPSVGLSPCLVVQDEEQRDLPPPDILKELGRSQTASFDVNFPSIENTYTMFVNVAEDQIYPLEWNDFLEVARENDDKLTPLSKGHKGSHRSTSIALLDPVTNAAAQTTSPTDVPDSESLSDSKKFRLFPNFRDASSRRSKRMEAARNRRRLLDGKNDTKKEKKDRVPKLDGKSDTENEKKDQTPKMESSPSSSSLQASVTQKTSVSEVSESPTNGDMGLHELASRILGKDVRKSENVDFTKQKRSRKKKKQAPVIPNSTSFPAEFPSDAMWDVAKSTKEEHLSRDDEIVAYDNGKSTNGPSDLTAVTPGVEAKINEEKQVPVSTSEKKPTIDTLLSKSFDDVYHSFIVKSIKKEIESPNVIPAVAPLSVDSESKSLRNQNQEIPLSPKKSDDVFELKWFDFGKQLWPHAAPSPVRNDVRRPTIEDKQNTDARDDAPTSISIGSLSEILRTDPSIASQEVDETPNAPNDLPPAHGEITPVVSGPVEADDEDIASVASSAMTPLYPPFLARASSWLSRFGTKANGFVACIQSPFVESRSRKKSRRSKKIVAAPSLEKIRESAPMETRDEIDEYMEISASKDAISRVESRTSSVSSNSVASSKSFDSEHSDISSSDEEENVSRASSFDSAENVEVGWCG